MRQASKTPALTSALRISQAVIVEPFFTMIKSLIVLMIELCDHYPLRLPLDRHHDAAITDSDGGISAGKALEQVFELLFGEPLCLIFTLSLGRARY